MPLDQLGFCIRKLKFIHTLLINTVKMQLVVHVILLSGKIHCKGKSGKWKFTQIWESLEIMNKRDQITDHKRRIITSKRSVWQIRSIEGQTMAGQYIQKVKDVTVTNGMATLLKWEVSNDQYCHCLLGERHKC